MIDREKVAPADVPIHEILARRWSPRAFESRPVEPEKLRSLFEAARWAASSSNVQPWRFIVAAKEDQENFERVLKCFVESNQIWARHAPVIGLSVAALKRPNNGQPNRHAFHDVGQAAANMAVQAAALGLQIHQMGGILPDKGREIFHIPDGFEVVAGIAIGYTGDPASLPDRLREREVARRERRPASSFVFTGAWGETSPLASGP